MSDTPPAASAVPAGAAQAPPHVAVAAGPAGRNGPAGAGRAGRPRRTGWRAAFFALAALALAGGVGWTLLGNRLLVVRSVTVTGTHVLAPGQVSAAADVRLGTPLLSVDTGAVTRRVESLTQVASASVAEEWPDRLVITVTERAAALAVRMADGSYDQVDPAGVIVGNTKARPAALPLLVTALPGRALRGSPDVAAAAGVLAELQPWLARQVAQVRTAALPAGPEQVTLSLRDGKTVDWGTAGDAAQKNRELSILLPGRVSEVDVSSPGTVVTR